MNLSYVSNSDFAQYDRTHLHMESIVATITQKQEPTTGKPLLSLYTELNSHKHHLNRVNPLLLCGFQSLHINRVNFTEVDQPDKDREIAHLDDTIYYLDELRTEHRDSSLRVDFKGHGLVLL